jgi:hypothetical protein
MLRDQCAGKPAGGNADDRCAMRAGDDAVVVSGITLHFVHGLHAAARAAGEIVVMGRASVVSRDEFLRVHRSEMLPTMPKVLQTTRLADRPVQFRDLVTGIGADACEATIHTARQTLIAKESGEPAVANAKHSPIPIRRLRQP